MEAARRREQSNGGRPEGWPANVSPSATALGARAGKNLPPRYFTRRPAERFWWHASMICFRQQLIGEDQQAKDLSLDLGERLVRALTKVRWYDHSSDFLPG